MGGTVIARPDPLEKIRWISPIGQCILFTNCDRITIDRECDTLYISGREEDCEYEIPGGIEMEDAEELVERWRAYLETLIPAKPNPGTAEAHNQGCECLVEYVHDPQCPVVFYLNNNEKPKTESEPKHQPETPTDHLNDILADLAHRLMEQNVSLDGLLAALKPRTKVDPFYVPIPGFKHLADRDPTDIERQCFYAGVMQFGKALKNFNITDSLARFWDSLGVPTVRCSGCGHRVPMERAFRGLEDGNNYGVDCCSDKVDGKLQLSSKEQG